jgi:hypothetical protein
MWGKVYGKKLFLPDGIERMATQIPREAGLSAERFISANTIFPWLKPFIPQERGEKLLDALKNGNPNIYNIIAFTRVIEPQSSFLRYCPECVEHDITEYGEAYWHRIHQLPGITVCPVHNAFMPESYVRYSDIRNEYVTAQKALYGSEQSAEYNSDVRTLELAKDALWLLQNGSKLGYLEKTSALYDRWLLIKGYRDSSGRTSRKKLAEALVDYYGQEFLSIFDAYNSGSCLWLLRIVQNTGMFQNPMRHIMLMRLLAGSTAAFFAGTSDDIPEFQPYGEPPYPCRNVVCEYHLQDVIEHIEVIHSRKGSYKATFSCPHCGFTYRRKTPIPKEEQYAGQIDIVAYGWKWERSVTELLFGDVSPYIIAHDFHCDVRTILDFGVERGILPEERLIKKRPQYVPIESSSGKPDVSERREQYRKRWLNVIAANPGVTRNELRLIDGKAYQWLHLHDAEWLKTNSPPSKKSLPKWVESDEEYAERIENAMKRTRDSPGKPKRLSVAALGEIAGIPKIHKIIASDRMPRTKAAVENCSETLEQWQRRKIRWAIQQMRERGEVITVYKVRHRATIEDKERKWDGFIEQTIISSK